MKPGEMLSADQVRQWRLTLRLTFAYEGDKIELIGRRSVEMIPPAPNTALPDAEQASFWFVVQDDKREVFYYRVIRNPMSQSFEVFSPAAEQTITNVDRERPRGTFEILVPDTPDTASLLFFTSNPPVSGKGEPGRRQQPAREVARFDLRTEQGR
jgi:hypothetical protein